LYQIEYKFIYFKKNNKYRESGKFLFGTIQILTKNSKIWLKKTAELINIYKNIQIQQNLSNLRNSANNSKIEIFDQDTGKKRIKIVKRKNPQRVERIYIYNPEFENKQIQSGTKKKFPDSTI